MMDVDITKKVSKALKSTSEEQDANAAVALIIKSIDRDTKILLVKRVENPADPWSGQMALPGGKRDAEDQNLIQTVVRETLEETGVNLLHKCRFLGVMTTFSSVPKPEVKILPFIVLLEHEPKIILNKKELEGFFWISPKELSKHKGIAKLSFGETPAYIVDGNIIWGLTYRILENFLNILRKHC